MSLPTTTGERQGSLWGERITFVGAVVTILLTIWNAYTKGKIDEANTQIESRRAAVDESRERVERYRFVLTTLSGLDKKDAREQQLAVAIARLALSGSESADLFAGLAATPDSQLRALGRTGATQTQLQSRRDPSAAATSERQGYEMLLRKDFEGAASSFEAAERAYPTYHQAYELSRYLRRAVRTGATPSAILQAVLQEYSLFATPEERATLDRLARQ